MSQEKNYTDSYLFDSYAIFEVMKGNLNYLPYTDCNVILTKLNLFELYHGFLKDNNEYLAEISIKKFIDCAYDFDDEVIKAAARMKNSLNRRDLSMADCIGYCLAKQLGIKFLTGDNQFKDLDNVQFVK